MYRCSKIKRNWKVNQRRNATLKLIIILLLTRILILNLNIKTKAKI